MSARHPTRLLAGIAVGLGLLLGATATRAADLASSKLRFESKQNGDLILHAHGATLGSVLRSLAAIEGFDVVMNEHVPRRPVHLTAATEPLDHVLRQILRGRNYALIYGDDDALTLEQIIVLVPSTASPRSITRRSGVRRGPGNARR